MPKAAAICVALSLQNVIEMYNKKAISQLMTYCLEGKAAECINQHRWPCELSSTSALPLHELFQHLYA